MVVARVFYTSSNKDYENSRFYKAAAFIFAERPVHCLLNFRKHSGSHVDVRKD